MNLNATTSTDLRYFYHSRFVCFDIFATQEPKKKEEDMKNESKKNATTRLNLIVQKIIFIYCTTITH